MSKNKIPLTIVPTESSTTTNHSTTTTTTINIDTPLTLTPPSSAGVYPTAAAIEFYLKTHANQNNYHITSLDTRETFTTWKCAIGPNRKHKVAQKKAEQQNQTLTIPTCPFKVIAKRNPEDHTWYIKIKEPTHNHGPNPDLKQMKLPDLTNNVPTKPQKRKRSKVVPQVPSQPKTSPSSQNTFQIPACYQNLFNKMQLLDDNIKDCLLDRFIRDCDLANEIKIKSQKSQEINLQNQPMEEDEGLEEEDSAEQNEENKGSNEIEENAEKQRKHRRSTN